MGTFAGGTQTAGSQYRARGSIANDEIDFEVLYLFSYVFVFDFDLLQLEFDLFDRACPLWWYAV